LVVTLDTAVWGPLTRDPVKYWTQSVCLSLCLS